MLPSGAPSAAGISSSVRRLVPRLEVLITGRYAAKMGEVVERRRACPERVGIAGLSYLVGLAGTSAGLGGRAGVCE